jgi:hypothetical protein
MESGPAKYFIKRLEILNPATLLTCRALCQWWCAEIGETAFCSALIAKHKAIFNLLNYDREIYDEFYYQRHILQNDFLELKSSYESFKLPRVETMMSDLDDEKVSYISSVEIPVDIKIFFYEYFQNISIVINLYTADVIKKTIANQTGYLRNLIYTKGIDSILFTVLFMPFCHTTHIKNNIRDSNYSNILCFCNVVDTSIENEFPNIDERYIILQMDPMETLESFLIEKTETIKISSSLYFVSQLMDLATAIETLLTKD